MISASYFELRGYPPQKSWKFQKIFYFCFWLKIYRRIQIWKPFIKIIFRIRVICWFLTPGAFDFSLATPIATMFPFFLESCVPQKSGNFIHSRFNTSSMLYGTFNHNLKAQTFYFACCEYLIFVVNTGKVS